MPIYTFQCKKCEHLYDELTAIDKTGEYVTVKCPECGSKCKERKMSKCEFNFKEPEGTKRWHSSSKGHDYRYKHNIPKVDEERKHAERNSHVGPNPYGDVYNI